MDHRADAFGGQARIGPAAEGCHVVATIPQSPAERTADETAPAGDERFHAWPARSVVGSSISMAACVAAQTASRSRKILALWRASTGNEG